MGNVETAGILRVEAAGTQAVVKRRTPWMKIRRHWQYYLMVALPLTYVIIFKYIPMVGAQIAFRDFSPVEGIWGSEWVGLEHFLLFFKSPYFIPLIRNVVSINVLVMTLGFVSPIILALALNEIRNIAFKRSVQMVTYFPHFISTVVMASMIILFLNPRVGFSGNLARFLGRDPVDFMGIAVAFPWIYVFSEIWQRSGFGAIIYMAALAGINPELYEAARIDGASRLQKIRHIDLTGILPTIIILLILQSAEVMNLGFEKVFLLQNPLNLPNSEVIATYVYKIGLINASFSFGAAVGLFNSAINFTLIIVINAIARRVSEHSLW
jgi:putative aldouronate transport system permease protein